MLDMFFESAENVLAFYIRYAQLAGFDIRRNITRNNDHAQEVECKASGQYNGGPGPDRTRDKTTEKKKCKAMMCIARSATQLGK
jgi:soluble lytic murein transglycosylase-like protein